MSSLSETTRKLQLLELLEQVTSATFLWQVIINVLGYVFKNRMHCNVSKGIPDENTNMMSNKLETKFIHSFSKAKFYNYKNLMDEVFVCMYLCMKINFILCVLRFIIFLCRYFRFDFISGNSTFLSFVSWQSTGIGAEAAYSIVYRRSLANS